MKLPAGKLHRVGLHGKCARHLVVQDRLHECKNVSKALGIPLNIWHANRLSDTLQQLHCLSGGECHQPAAAVVASTTLKRKVFASYVKLEAVCIKHLLCGAQRGF